MNSKEVLERLVGNKVFILLERSQGKKQFVNDINIIKKDLEILEEYRKIEEELGIELTVLFSALKYGIYYIEDNCQRVYDNVSLISNYISTGPHDKLSYSFITHNTKQILLFGNMGKLGF